MKRLINILLGIIATIILGAIGSGLWERLLGPFLDWLTKSTIGLYASVMLTYRDSIYENAAKGFHESNSLAVHTIVIMLLPLLYFYVLQRHPTKTRDPNDPVRLFIRSRRGYWLLFGLTIAVMFGTMFSALRLRHINETITYTLASFEIVRPSVGEAKYVELRSRYFAMRTAAEFQAIHEEVLAVAKQQGRILPAYEPL